MIKSWIYTIFTSLFILISLFGSGQIHCGSVDFVPNTAMTADFTFDSFGKYVGGVTINNVGQLRISVQDKVVPDAACKWFLTMEVFNNPGAGTPATEWETLTTYGTGALPEPTIDIFEIRIRNNCQTSPIDGTFQTFTNHADVLDIIADLLPRNDAGNCNLNVNGPGDYLTDYGEFTFIIDIRIQPNYDFRPGIYELMVTFDLEEQL